MKRSFTDPRVYKRMMGFERRQDERAAKRERLKTYQRRYMAWLKGEGPDPRRAAYVAEKMGRGE